MHLSALLSKALHENCLATDDLSYAVNINDIQAKAQAMDHDGECAMKIKEVKCINLLEDMHEMRTLGK